MKEDDSTRLFSVIARRYVREVLPAKAASTRRDNEKALTNLLRVFGHVPIDFIATGELAAVIDRINAHPKKAISALLIQDENGQPLSLFALRSRIDKAREAAKVSFQFRDIRAKAATDTGDLAHSQRLLAHENRRMTDHYVRARTGERIRHLRRSAPCWGHGVNSARWIRTS